MRKIFDKLNKIMFIVGIAALIILVLILSGCLDTLGENVISIIMMICVLSILVCGMFAAISAVFAIMEGIKKDKVALLKKFFSNVLLIAITYGVIFGLDYFIEAELPLEFNLGKVVVQILVCALAILGGEYMITDHKDEKELHF